MNKVHRQKCLKTGFAKDRLGWAGRKGRHGGEAPALCVGTDDVGLDFSLPFYQEKGRKDTAAIDARHRTSLRWDDMAAEPNAGMTWAERLA